MAIDNFLPKENELKEMSIQFNEGQRLYGFKVDLYVPTSYTIPNKGYEKIFNYNLEDKITCYVTIDRNAKKKLLQNLGWFIEDEEDKPIICYIAKWIQPIYEDRNYQTEPFVDPELKNIIVKEGSVLLLDYSYNDIGRQFKVVEVAANNFNPIYYICKIEAYKESLIDLGEETPPINQEINEEITQEMEDKNIETDVTSDKRQEDIDLQEPTSDGSNVGNGRRFLNY